VNEPWYRRRGLLAVVAVVVLVGGVLVGLALSAGDDGDDGVATGGSTAATTTVAPTTVPAPATTAVTPTTLSAEDRCAAGDQVGCDQLSDERLDELCDDGHGNLDACQVLLAHQGDGEPDGPNGEGDRGGDEGD
jgi:hypothetical protein